MTSSDALVTPEAVALDRPLAGVGSRGLAYLLDLLVMASVALVVILSGTAVLSAAAVDVPGWITVVLTLLLLFAVQFGYPVTFETRWRGRTPGKAAMGLRVVTVEGGPVGFRHAAVRAVLGIVDFQLTLGAAAFVTAIVTRRSQRLGDLAAGTVVVRERHAAGPAVAASFAPPPDLVAYTAQLDVSRLDARTYQAVRTLLQRADDLEPDARARLGRELADRVRGRIAPPPPTGTPDLALLRAVAAAVQRRGHGQPPAPPPSDPTARAGPTAPSVPPAGRHRDSEQLERDDGDAGFAPPR